MFSISQVKPLPGYILVEPIKEETKTKSGVILNEDNEKPQHGKVLAVGAKELEQPAEWLIKNGQVVLYKKWGGSEVTIEDKEYQFLKYEDVLAIIK